MNGVNRYWISFDLIVEHGGCRGPLPPCCIPAYVRLCCIPRLLAELLSLSSSSLSSLLVPVRKQGKVKAASESQCLRETHLCFEIFFFLFLFTLSIHMKSPAALSSLLSIMFERVAESDHLPKVRPRSLALTRVDVASSALINAVFLKVESSALALVDPIPDKSIRVSKSSTSMTARSMSDRCRSACARTACSCIIRAVCGSSGTKLPNCERVLE